MSLPQLPHRGSEKSATQKLLAAPPSANTFKFCNTIGGKAEVGGWARNDAIDPSRSSADHLCCIAAAPFHHRARAVSDTTSLVVATQGNQR